MHREHCVGTKCGHRTKDISKLGVPSQNIVFIDVTNPIERPLIEVFALIG